MNNPINYARSLAALFIGFFVMAAIDTLLTAAALKVFFSAPTASGNQPLGLLFVKVFSGVVGGFVTATLANKFRWQHALILACVLVAIGLTAMQAMPDAARSSYTTYALLLTPISIVIGGLWRHRQSV